MATDNLVGVAGGWEGYALGTVGRVPASDERPREEVNIELLAIAERLPAPASAISKVPDAAAAG